MQPVRKWGLPGFAAAGAFFCWMAGSAEGAITGLERRVTGLTNPVFVTHAPGDSERLFILEQGGQIRIFNPETEELNATPFLVIPDTDNFREGGLLGLAFHPDYQQNGRFFVYVTVDDAEPFSSHVREYGVSGNPDLADPAPTEILQFAQPEANHNAGWIGFNPSVGANDPQYLYVMTGDGGGSGDPDNHAQTLSGDLLGKVLRIDVDGDDFPGDPGTNYAVPLDNPFVGETGDDEIWAYGLRNPFRASFDRETGDLWIGDVGQNAREEINFQPAASPGGENYAWKRREGLIGFQGGSLEPGDVEPVYDYPHGSAAFEGNSVTGGYVYRGPDPDLRGLYFFADFVSSNVWTFDPADPPGTVDNINDLLVADAGSLSSPASLGEDLAGNLYLVDYGGEVFAIATPEPGGALLGLTAFLTLFGCRVSANRRARSSRGG